MLAHTLPVENKIKDMQYKILFRFLPTSKLLYKMKKRNTPNCLWCLTEVHTIEHLFYNCVKVKCFWLKLCDALGRICKIEYPFLKLRDIILGYKFVNILENREVNTIILQAKYYIFKSHINEKELHMPSFCNVLANYVLYFQASVEGTSNQTKC